jgi:hypothetical protein
MTTTPSAVRLVEHVDRIAEEHPPVPLESVDFTVRRPYEVAARFGGVLDYMARAELEVERNVLELTTLLPDPPAVDRRFYAEVWGPQEARHGLILDLVQLHLGRPPADTDLTTVSPRLRALGLLAHLTPVQDVVRMLYYLTGMTTERSALLAYHRLHDGVLALGEDALAHTVITPIRHQEPGHYAYYQLAARLLWSRLSGWQRWLVRHLRAATFSPVGASSAEQHADVGQMLLDLGVEGPGEAAELAVEVAHVETQLLFAERAGVTVPPYVAAAFREAVELALARAAA